MKEIHKKMKLGVKVGLVGDFQVGKSSFETAFVDGTFVDPYPNFTEKTVHLKHAEITFNIWDIRDRRDFERRFPVVCNDADAIFFMFDLTRISTLNSIREWYKQVRALNKTAIPFLIGTKYDLLVNITIENQQEITKKARVYAAGMKAPLIFCSAVQRINITKIFQILVYKACNFPCTMPHISKVGEPILEY